MREQILLMALVTFLIAEFFKNSDRDIHQDRGIHQAGDPGSNLTKAKKFLSGFPD